MDFTLYAIIDEDFLAGAVCDSDVRPDDEGLVSDFDGGLASARDRAHAPAYGRLSDPETRIPIPRLIDVCVELVRSGATVIQYRAKSLARELFLDRAQSIAAIIRVRAVPLIINDRVDVAAACDAAGVHLGREDVSIAEARRILGPGRTVGRTVRTAAEAVKAERDGADYLGAGSIFPSPTKSGIPVIGLEGLKAIRSSVKIPIVAIGGLTLANLPDVVAAGADGLAFVSELFRGASVAARAQELRAAIDGARRRAER
ncbi:MAG: thiamine phosphate synthase [Candidatus Eisenbacteria bacterium]